MTFLELKRTGPAAVLLLCAAGLWGCDSDSAAPASTSGGGTTGTGAPAGTNASGGAATNGTGTGTNGTGTGTATNGSTGTSTSGGSDAGAGGTGVDQFFRADLMRMTEPTLVADFAQTGIFVTDITGQVQSAIDDALTMDVEPDGDGDGYIDLNVFVRIAGGLDLTKSGGMASAGGAHCAFPFDSDVPCAPFEAVPFLDEMPFAIQTDAPCVVEGTNDQADPPCIKTEKAPFTFNTSVFGAIPLTSTQVVGHYNEANGRLENGFIRGFLSEEIATKTKLPAELPVAAVLIGVQAEEPFVNFLKDDEKGEDNGTPGWWFQASVTGAPALYDPSLPDPTL